MAKDPETPGPLDTLADEARSRAARAAVEAAAEAAVATAGRVANGVLDGLESLLFGRVGAAEEAAKADDPDPLARIRAKYDADVAAVHRADGADGATKREAAPAAPVQAAPPRPAKEDPVVRARAELEALKAARDARNARDVKETGAHAEPVKKTL